MKFDFEPIGFIRSRFTSQAGTPVQGTMVPDEGGTVEVLPEFRDGLADLEGFSHVILIYVFHKIQGSALRVVPYLDTNEHGIFATRSPKRPNPIGSTVVRLNRVTGETLEITGIDMLDGTPVLDIKPYVPAFDRHDTDRIGWFEGKLPPAVSSAPVLADNRFDAKVKPSS